MKIRKERRKERVCALKNCAKRISSYVLGVIVYLFEIWVFDWIDVYDGVSGRLWMLDVDEEESDVEVRE